MTIIKRIRKIGRWWETFSAMDVFYMVYFLILLCQMLWSCVWFLYMIFIMC